jgi:glycerol-3-phosphate acyltransferase PlsX
VELVLVGDGRAIEPHLPAAAGVEVVHAPEFVPPHAPPVQAARRKDTSLARGLEILAQGKADAFLSPGNTGAVVAAALLRLGRLPGVKRPGLCASLPTLVGKEFLLIDVGATADPKPEHLVQFALMGRLYAQEVLGFSQPTVGLLSIGAEAEKGDKLMRATHALLREEEWFSGNVEPHELLTRRPVDVVVCGGVPGNLTLKALEGGAEAAWTALKGALLGSLRGKLAGWLARPALKALARSLAYDRYNGAPLLGVAGLVLVAHGRSTAGAMEGALQRTFWAAQAEIVQRLGEKLKACSK